MRRNVWATRTERQSERRQARSPMRCAAIGSTPSRPGRATLSPAQPRGPADRHVAFAPALLVGRHAGGRSGSPGIEPFRPVDRPGLRHRCIPDAWRGLHMERYDGPGFRRRRGAHEITANPVRPSNPETGLRLARGPVAAGLLHPADLQLVRHRARHRVAHAGGDLSLRQALHLVAAGIPRASRSTGARCWPGRRIPDRWAGQPCSFILAASPGRFSTTRSTPIRIPRMTP
jgi:hypothetical protein